MGFEVWIGIILLAAGLSGWVGYAYAKKNAPKQSELDAMAAELDEARQQADSVEANVSEHFEQSAMLFGKLAADYREFLDHFESSAQNLGLSEARARELIEQGFQPLVTHEVSDAAAVVTQTIEAETDAPAETETELENPADVELGDEIEQTTADVGEVTVDLPDDALMTAAGTDSQTEQSSPDEGGIESIQDQDQDQDQARQRA
jgi:uncharacterized membrane-anchored protein YhcB (DUF1043 family)